MLPRTLLGMVNEYKKTKRMERAWLTDRSLKIYVRVTRRYINGSILDCLDVASVEAPEKSRGKGMFTRWMDKAEALAAENQMVVYVESILNHRLFGFFRNRGYTLLMGVPDSMFKLPPATAPSARR